MATTGMRANCPRCKTNSWISNTVTDEVKKGFLKCMECGYLAKEYDIEYCFAQRYVYNELIEARKEIESLKEKLHKATDVIKSLGVDNCPICNNDNWFDEYDSYPVPKGMLRCSQCGYLKSKYQSEFVIAPRDIYSQLVEARKEIVLLKDRIEELKSIEKKADKYKIISVRPATDGYINWTYFDISVYGEKPKVFIRQSSDIWTTDIMMELPKSESEKLERLYRKMMGFYV